MTLKDFLEKSKFPDIYFDSINNCALIDAGIPFFIIAPPSGGKTTIIKFLEEYFKSKLFTYVLERFSPMRLVVLQDRINTSKEILFLAEDFSTMGEDQSAVFKMATIISKLAYDHRYIDTFYSDKNHEEGLALNVDKLSFVCGCQPLWLTIYAGKEVFETLIMEKILRYYRLPIMPISETTPMKEVVSYLCEHIKPSKGYEPKKEDVEILKKALSVQAGARALEYSKLVSESLTKFVSKELYSEWVLQFSRRLSFEQRFLMRYYEPMRGLVAYSLHKEYSVLFFTMQYANCTFNMLRHFLKVRAKSKSKTRQYMSYLIKSARETGYVSCFRMSKDMMVLPSKLYRQLWLKDNVKVQKHDSV